MKRLVKSLIIMAIMAAMSASAAVAGSNKTSATNSGKGKEKKTQISKLANNDKILSDKGLKAIKETDILSVWVRKDTVIFELKKDSFKRIDKDRSNYKIDNNTKKASSHKAL
ncbi:MAG: hypothetical protein J5995_08845 [Muribaculaceae bacterium]|nr:hypothetical protein [Muribaculaceae bacterium]